MDLRIDTLRLKLALFAALGLAVFFSAASGAQAAGGPGARVPRVSLSVPPEVTKAVPVIAQGKVVPPRQGRILLQARRGRVWRPLATGKVRHGRFRISFALRGPAPSASRLRATLLLGRRSVANSPTRKVRIRAASAAPEPPAPPAIAVSPAEAVDPVAGAVSPPGDAYWGAWIGPQLTGTAAPWDMDAVSQFEQLVGKPLSILEFSTPFANCAKTPCDFYEFPAGPFGSIRSLAGEVADEKLGGAKKLAGLKDLFGGSSNGDGDDSEEATEAHGSGRRMPIQQSVDVAVPISEAYDQWTRFEEWPKFMHRVDSAQQVDDSTVSFSTKVWGITKQFEAEIVEQRPDERIEWHTEEGLMHSGVVTFHELAPRLTRIEVSMDVKPDSLVEKAGRGMRFTKRAVRGDLHRFKAFVEMEEETEDGWRGTIEDGDVKRKSQRKSKSR
jgi:uncharacterized membrane protein